MLVALGCRVWQESRIAGDRLESWEVVPGPSVDPHGLAGSSRVAAPILDVDLGSNRPIEILETDAIDPVGQVVPRPAGRGSGIGHALPAVGVYERAVPDVLTPHIAGLRFSNGDGDIQQEGGGDQREGHWVVRSQSGR